MIYRIIQQSIYS